MGLNKVLLLIDWSSIFCFLVYFITSSSLPCLSKMLMVHLHFPYPMTIAFIYSTTTVVCLWFWTVLSVFKPRTIGFFKKILPLSMLFTIQTICQYRLLFNTTLLHYQMFKIISYTLAMTKSLYHILPICMGSILLFIYHPLTHPITFIMCILLSIYTDNGNNFYPAKLRRKIHASDLQYQLFLRSTSTLFLFMLCPFLDLDVSSISNSLTSIFTTTSLSTFSFSDIQNSFILDNIEYFNLHFRTNSQTFLNPFHLIANRLNNIDDISCLFLYTSALMAFIAFISVRVAHCKLHPLAFRSASVISSAPIFMVHFFFYESPRTFDGPIIIFILAAANHISLSTYSPSHFDNEAIENESSESEHSDEEEINTNSSTAMNNIDSDSINNTDSNKNSVIILIDNEIRNASSASTSNDDNNQRQSNVMVNSSISDKNLHLRHVGQANTNQNHHSTRKTYQIGSFF